MCATPLRAASRIDPAIRTLPPSMLPFAGYSEPSTESTSTPI
jgi:hypothetical protein